MSECNKCSEQVNEKEAVVCAECKHVFHAKCTKIGSVDKFKKLSVAAKTSWRCDSCKSETSSRSEGDDSNEDRVLRAIERMRREMNSKFSSVDANVESVKERLDGVNSAIDKINKSLESMGKENEARKEEYATLANENRQLKLDMEDMKNQLLDVQQYSRKSNVEIVGVPFTRGEDMKSILHKIAAVIEVTLNEGDISIVHRLPKSKRNNHPSIVAQFVCRSTKEDWITAARTHRKRLTAAELSDNFPSTYVFINDHLTVANKIVLGRAKALAKQRKLRFAWTRDCKVLVRQTEDSEAVQVRSLQDLDQLLEGDNSKNK